MIPDKKNKERQEKGEWDVAPNQKNNQ